MPVGSFRDLDPATWDGPIRVNLHGVMNGAKAVVDGMCERGHGRVITISSGAGTAGVAIGVSFAVPGAGRAAASPPSPARSPSRWARHGVTANTWRSA